MTETKHVRMPETPEEIEVVRKRKQEHRIVFTIGTIFFALILIIVPKTPNSALYIEVNSFLDNYLFGYFLPDFSDKFYFSIKVVWCLSFVYQFFMIFLWSWVIHVRYGCEGLRILLYFAEYDLKSELMILFFNFFAVFTIVFCFYISIIPYAFESTHALDIMRDFDMFFYGDFFSASVLLICAQVFISSSMIFILLANIYFFIFCECKFN